MAYKKVPHEVKVEALKEAIELKSIDEIAKKYGISRSTIKSDFDKVIGQIDTTIKDKKPGPKIKTFKKIVKIHEKKPKNVKVCKEDLECQKCGGKNIIKNGTYEVTNWVVNIIAKMLPFLQLNTKKVIQKYMCTDCGASVAGEQCKANNYLKQAIKLQIGRLICILRFKEGLSVRAISYIVKSIFGVNGSTGYIVELCNKVAVNGKKKLEEINSCSQNDAKVMIFDETFPKAKGKGTTNLGVVMDENGLIRGVQTIIKKNRI